MIIAILLVTLMLNSVLVSAMTTTSDGDDDVTIELISPEDGAENVDVDSTDCCKVYVKLNIQTDYYVNYIQFLRYEDDEELGGLQNKDIEENGDAEGVIYWANYNTAYNWYVKVIYDYGHYEMTAPSDGYWSFTTREYDEPPTADFTWEEIEVCEDMNKIRFDSSPSSEDAILFEWTFKSFPDDEILEQKEGKIVEYTPGDFDEYRAILQVFDEYGQMGETDSLFQLKHDPPTLSDPRVKYETTGKAGERFTFSIHYYDKYGHEPEDCTGACVVAIKYPDTEYKDIQYEDLIPEDLDSANTTLSVTLKLLPAGQYKYRFIVHDEQDGNDPDKAVYYPDQGWLPLTVKGMPKSVLKFRDGFLAKILDYLPNAFPLLRMLLKL